jgi:hypothetical protein
MYMDELFDVLDVTKKKYPATLTHISLALSFITAKIRVAVYSFVSLIYGFEFIWVGRSIT